MYKNYQKNDNRAALDEWPDGNEYWLTIGMSTYFKIF